MKWPKILAEKSINFKIISLLALYTAIGHTLLFIYDINHPDVFLNADRARQRLVTIKAILANEGDENLFYLLSQAGIVGDYLLHAIVYSALGQYGVIIFQILLLLVSIIFLFHFLFIIAKSRFIAIVAVVLYLHLPHTIVFPHQLTAEALFDPLIIFSFYGMAKYILVEQRWLLLMNSAFFVGFASLIRPVTLLWPIVVIAIMILTFQSTRRISHWASYLAIAVMPFILWMFFIFSQTGIFSMGSSNHDVSHNLYDRVNRIITSFPLDQQQLLIHRYLDSAETKKMLSIPEYLSFVIDHPYGYFSQLGRDALVFCIKSGINRISLDYLDVEARKSFRHWRKVWEKHSLFYSMKSLGKSHPKSIFFAIFGTILFIPFMMGSLFGGLQSIKKYKQLSPPEQTLYILLLVFPVYLFFASQVANAMMSRHRAPGEFILCFFAALALHQWYKARGKGDKMTSIPSSG
jgi:4-amino-4-deoxy-L-arabinose transferase-like glycosyltransferase